MQKDEFYKWIKLAGMLSYIPFVLVTGPLSGYWIGEYLIKRWHLSRGVLFFVVLMGTFVSIQEVIRIIRLVSNIDKK